MAKRKRIWNEDKYRRYVAEGRGQGVLSAYKPWIYIHDFPSKGVVSRVKGITTGRIHHLLSNYELCYFYLLDWSEKAIDIREQFPLADLSDAIRIADKMGVRYPYNMVSGFPYVLTSDFLITTKDGMVARSVKHTKDLENPRVREKLEIERQYWKARDINWQLVTEKEISKTKARNIEWLLTGSDLSELIAADEIRHDSKEYFIELYADMSVNFSRILNTVEHDLNLQEGTAMCIFKTLVLERKISLDMEKSICLSEPRERSRL